MLRSLRSLRSLQENVAFFVLFYCMFFANKRCIFCILIRSKEKNTKERIIVLGLISRKKLKKERKRMLRSLKEPRLWIQHT